MTTLIWHIGWSLVLGFYISAVLQAVISRQGMVAALGRNGIVLVVILNFVGRLTYPERLVEAARHHPEAGGGHQHDAATAERGGSLWDQLSRRDTWVHVAQGFAMDRSMLWKDLLLGFLIAGVLSMFVPDGV